MHKKRMFHRFFLILILMAIFLGSCNSPQITQGLIHITIQSDSTTKEFSLPAGTTVQEALATEGISMGSLDRVDPPSYTALSEGIIVKVIRVQEDYEVNDITIPFDHQIVKNESLSAGQQLLIQAGINGTEEITTLIVYEDGVETSREEIKTVVIKEAVPEIVMVGVQAPFTSLNIPGRLTYLIAGNAWLMESTTGNRLPIVTTGDLDGRIFSLSPDGNWLLFTREVSTANEDTINSLWVVRITDPVSEPMSLGIENIVLFSDWVPGETQTISYSTVEPRATSPGWQSNNDFHILTFGSDGSILSDKEIIGTNSGGIYGWWGTQFAWSPDGASLAYSRPDEIGLVDIQTGTFLTKIKVTPLQTNSEWAWVPPINWSPNGDALFTVIHSPGSNQVSAQESQVFDLDAILLNYGLTLPLVEQSGMFAYPVTSPEINNGYQICFLQAVFPDQSQTSHYKLVVMNQDGANQKTIFPPDGSTGMDPQQIVWAPLTEDQSTGIIALIYDGNIWLVDLSTGESHQITGDGLTSKIDWK
jgi:resuscitation-promoting factor RpfB